MSEYIAKESIPIYVDFKVGSVTVDTTYTANQPMTDPVKGLAQITVRDSNDVIVNDSTATPINSLPMFRDKDKAYRAVFTIATGIQVTQSTTYTAVISYKIPYNNPTGFIQKRIEKKIIINPTTVTSTVAA